jgi:uncharacterized OB-fold protein
MPPTAHLIDAELAPAEARIAGRKGLVATAAWDEDAVTLGARAGLAVLDRNPDHRPEALVTATVSAPLAEPGIAPYLAEVFDLQGFAVHASEHGGSVAAGLAAVAEAVALIATGLDPVLVVAADTRRDSRGRALGDGAVALLIGSEGGAGVIERAGAAVELFVERWRRRGESGIEAGDRSLDRFGPGKAFAGTLDTGGHKTIISTTADGPALARCGFLGCAAPLAELLIADVEPGDNVLATASAGGVSHGLRFEAGPDMPAVAMRARANLEAGTESPPPQAPDEDAFDPFTSQAGSRRERGATYRLEARRDPATGEVIYPPPPAAIAAHLEPTRLARTGTVLTFARDHVFPMGGPLTMAVVSLDGGGRFYGQVAGGGTVAIGDRVQLVLRRLHSGGGLPHYFWKVSAEDGDT